MAKTTESKVGTETISYCTSCKMDLGHVIVAMKGERIAKVQCKTCKKEHAFKAAKGVNEPDKEPKAPKVAKARASKASAASPVAAEWSKLILASKDKPLKPYAMKGVFALGDRLAHESFGEGIVSRVIHPNKVEVIFETDVKKLIHQTLAK